MQPVFANILNRMVFGLKRMIFREVDMLWVCLIGYEYSCTSIVIFLFKLFEAFNSIYFVKTGISELFFNISSKTKCGIW